MRDLVVLFLHLLTTVARLAGPGGARVVAESVLVKHQLLIHNRSRRRALNLHLADRMVAGACRQGTHLSNVGHGYRGPRVSKKMLVNACDASASEPWRRRHV